MSKPPRIQNTTNVYQEPWGTNNNHQYPLRTTTNFDNIPSQGHLCRGLPVGWPLEWCHFIPYINCINISSCHCVPLSCMKCIHVPYCTVSYIMMPLGVSRASAPMSQCSGHRLSRTSDSCPSEQEILQPLLSVGGTGHWGVLQNTLPRELGSSVHISSHWPNGRGKLNWAGRPNGIRCALVRGCWKWIGHVPNIVGEFLWCINICCVELEVCNIFAAKITLCVLQVQTFAGTPQIGG